MFLCRFDIGFFAYAIDFSQNFEWDKFWGKESLDLYLTITNMDSYLREEEPLALTLESIIV